MLNDLFNNENLLLTVVFFAFAASSSFCFLLAAALLGEGEGHKVYPLSTDPVPLYSIYSKLQNVNIGFLDSRLHKVSP